MENKCSTCGGKLTYDILKKCLICESCGTQSEVEGLEKIDSKVFYYPFNYTEARIKGNFEQGIAVVKIYEPYIYIQARGQITYKNRGEKRYYKKNFCSDIVSPKSKYMLGSMYRFLEDYDLIDSIPIDNEDFLNEEINRDLDKDKFIKTMAEAKLKKKLDVVEGYFDYDSFVEKTLYVPIFYVKNQNGQIINVVNGYTGRIIIESWVNPKGFFSQNSYGYAILMALIPFFILIILSI